MIDEILKRRSVGRIVVAALLGFLLGECLSLVADAILVSMLHFHGGMAALNTAASPPGWVNVSGLLGLWLGLIGVVVWCSREGGLPWRDDAWRLRGWTELGYLLLGVGCQLLIDAAYAPFHLHSLNAPVTHLFGGATGTAFLLLTLFTGFGAPVIEECFFRATLFRALDESWREPAGVWGGRAAIMASALVFGLAHGELVQLPGLVVLGVVLAVVYRRTERVLPSVLVHVGFNVSTVVYLISQRLGH